MDTAAATHPPRAFRKAGVGETAVLLAVAWFIPFGVHLVPWSGDVPLGAYLLPMFWAAFVAVYLYGGLIGLLIALFAPAINLLVTGLPAWKFVGGTSFELVVFVLISAWAVRRVWRFVLIAPLSYGAAHSAWVGLQATLSGSVRMETVSDHLVLSLTNAAAGLVFLAAIDAALVWFYPKTPNP